MVQVFGVQMGTSDYGSAILHKLTFRLQASFPVFFVEAVKVVEATISMCRHDFFALAE
jgi:hypothetical protein